MGQVRESIKSPQSFRVFPDDPAVFMAHHSGAYPEGELPVPPPMPESSILERAGKESVPLRSTNKKVLKKRPSGSSIVPRAGPSRGRTDWLDAVV